jgi:hypothetical protein
VLRLLPLCCAVLFAWAPAAQAADLRLGFFDGIFMSGERASWLDRARDSGSQVVRISLGWPGIAPVRPSDPMNPADPAYDWTNTDAAVADSLARGQEVLLSIDGAPHWAQGSDRPRRSDSHAWKPSPKALGAFATAAARRYAGRVRAYQVFNEPNLDKYLAPQWVRRKGRLRAFAPGHYRKMLNAAYAGFKSVNRRNLVVTAGTAPYGDPVPGGGRIMPVRFWRTVLRKRTRFDVLAHHPYAIAGPNRRALNRDDVALPDLHKLRKLAPDKRLWVTEVSWDSSPPDPHGVPAKKHARWLAEAFYVLWRQEVDTILWFQIRDQPKGQGYEFGNQSGIHLVDGRAKRSQRAFAFPFVARRANGRTTLWGRAPATGQLTIERRSNGAWEHHSTFAVGHGRVFDRRTSAAGTFRARQGPAVSLPFRTRTS